MQTKLRIRRILYPFLLITLLATGCRLTRKNVIGKWQVTKDDTLFINADNSFRLSKFHTKKVNGINQVIDSARYNAEGVWVVYKGRTLSLNFNEKNEYAGECSRSFQYMWPFKGNKKHLMYPYSCKMPTNRFSSIDKIE